MPREETPRRQQDDGGVAGVRTGTPWDSIYPIAARFTNSASRFTRRLTGGVINFTGVHDTDLGPKKRKRFIEAGGVINPPGVKHKRGSPVYFWQGEKIGKKRAFQIVRQIKRGLIPAHAGGGNVGPTAADQAGSRPFSDFGFIATSGPRTRGRRRKKKKLRSAAAVLAARVLQTGEQVFSDLLAKGRSVARYVEPEFDRLLKKGPMSDFERLLHDKPFRAPVPEVAARAVSVVARAAGAAGLLLWPSSIGQEPPWSPPPPRGPKVTARPGPSGPLARPPRRVVLPAPSPTGPGQTTRRPLPRPESRPFPVPVSNPGTLPAPLPAPRATSAPSPSPVPRTGPSVAPRPSRTAFPSWLLSPLAAGIAAPGSVARSPRRVVVSKPQPLTGTQTAPASSNCDCQKPTRTKRERKKRCSNPVISRKRSGDTITTVRKIKCPA